MTKELESALERGLAAHQARRFGEALSHYQDALRLVPGDADALSFSGMALMELERGAEAETALRQAIAARPDEAAFRFNLVKLLEKACRYSDAIAEIQKIVDHDPKSVLAWERLGDIAVAQQNLDGADRAYTRSLMCGPSFSAALKQARVQAALGKYDGAMVALAQAAELHPDDERVLLLHAEILTAQGRWQELAVLARRWTVAAPQGAAAWRNLAVAAFELRRFREAADAARKMVELSQPSAEMLAAYGQICLQAQDFDAAEAALDNAEAMDPGLPEMLAGKARLLTFQGRFEEAKAYCRRAVTSDPNRADAYWTLCLLTRGSFEEREMEALIRLAHDKDLEPERRAMAAFALGQGHEARGATKEAFAAFEAAHAHKREHAARRGIAYNPARTEAHTANLMALFAAPPPAAPARHQGPRPVFILGMPRSGTTLIESLLAAHSRVFAGGERPRMQQILGQYLAQMQKSGARDPGEDQLKDWAEAYYQDLRDIGGASHTTDKYPLNFEAAGLIARVFPEAVILHTRRNPLETGLSIWRHEFPATWSFTHRLEDIGHFYGQYAKLAAHWQRVLGPRFITVQHEDLTRDFEGIAPGLVAACGLDWEESCVDFQSADRPVATMSAVQVREPVTEPPARAAHFQDYLKPLADALEKAGVDLTTGALID
ncbi:MAG: sulfotransferase [Pseudomonadota bacterium]|nr:sulfotransferase [Pseudomonadota bacterium]